MKIAKFFLASVLLLTALAMPGSALVTSGSGTCSFTCTSSSGSTWTGTAWASSLKACWDGCRKMCGSSVCSVNSYE
jgi:hypothetical protein